jgi:hypothetical protein
MRASWTPVAHAGGLLVADPLILPSRSRQCFSLLTHDFTELVVTTPYSTTTVQSLASAKPFRVEFSVVTLCRWGTANYQAPQAE